jgi:3-methyladenine DNA glycosylase/8-oxoguanine DNA glycosylase
VWEDLVKTLFSVNTTWRQTVAMTRNLVTHYGEPYEGSPGSFPSADTMSAADPAELQQICRLGYRAVSLVKIARAVDSGEADLEGLKDPAVSVEAAEARLRALPGIGPYAAANVLMLLGRYDHLPVDSWFRQTVRDGWFGGRDVSEREMVAAFDRYRPYRTLVYRFYDWEGAEAAGK